MNKFHAYSNLHIFITTININQTNCDIYYKTEINRKYRVNKIHVLLFLQIHLIAAQWDHSCCICQSFTLKTTNCGRGLAPVFSEWTTPGTAMNQLEKRRWRFSCPNLVKVPPYHRCTQTIQFAQQVQPFYQRICMGQPR